MHIPTAAIVLILVTVAVFYWFAVQLVDGFNPALGG